MKLLIGLVLALALIGCAERDSEQGIAITGYLPVYEICLKGITYYSSGRRLAPAFTSDSKVITCEMEQNTSTF